MRVVAVKNEKAIAICFVAGLGLRLKVVLTPL